MLQGGAPARAGEVVDEHCDLIVQHQRQVGLGSLDFGCGLGLDVGIDREGDVVGFVDRRWLRARLGKSVALLQRGQFKLMYGLDELVEFTFQPFVIAQVEIAGQQYVERLIEVGLGRLQVASLVIRLPGCVFLLRLGDQRFCRVRFGNGDIRSLGGRIGY